MSRSGLTHWPQNPRFQNVTIQNQRIISILIMRYLRSILVSVRNLSPGWAKDRFATGDTHLVERIRFFRGWIQKVSTERRFTRPDTRVKKEASSYGAPQASCTQQIF